MPGRKTVRRSQRQTGPGLDIGYWGYGALLVLLLVWGGLSGFRYVVAGYRTAGDVVEKSREYERLVKENETAAADLQYRQTEEGQIWAIIDGLGYIREDEQLLKPDIEPAPPSSRKPGVRFRNWVHRQCEAARQRTGDFKIQLMCWFGLWAPPGPRDVAEAPHPQG
ncbi:MAG: hypothetical protein ACLFWB_00530 [Armatimonadota bacterium]